MAARGNDDKKVVLSASVVVASMAVGTVGAMSTNNNPYAINNESITKVKFHTRILPIHIPNSSNVYKNIPNSDSFYGDLAIAMMQDGNQWKDIQQYMVPVDLDLDSSSWVEKNGKKTYEATISKSDFPVTNFIKIANILGYEFNDKDSFKTKWANNKSDYRINFTLDTKKKSNEKGKLDVMVETGDDSNRNDMVIFSEMKSDLFKNTSSTDQTPIKAQHSFINSLMLYDDFDSYMPNKHGVKGNTFQKKGKLDAKNKSGKWIASKTDKWEVESTNFAHFAPGISIHTNQWMIASSDPEEQSEYVAAQLELNKAVLKNQNGKRLAEIAKAFNSLDIKDKVNKLKTEFGIDLSKYDPKKIRLVAGPTGELTIIANVVKTKSGARKIDLTKTIKNGKTDSELIKAAKTAAETAFKNSQLPIDKIKDIEKAVGILEKIKKMLVDIDGTNITDKNIETALAKAKNDDTTALKITNDAQKAAQIVKDKYKEVDDAIKTATQAATKWKAATTEADKKIKEEALNKANEEVTKAIKATKDAKKLFDIAHAKIKAATVSAETSKKLLEDLISKKQDKTIIDATATVADMDKKVQATVKELTNAKTKVKAATDMLKDVKDKAIANKDPKFKVAYDKAVADAEAAKVAAEEFEKLAQVAYNKAKVAQAATKSVVDALNKLKVSSQANKEAIINIVEASETLAKYAIEDAKIAWDSMLAAQKNASEAKTKAESSMKAITDAMQKSKMTPKKMIIVGTAAGGLLMSSLSFGTLKLVKRKKSRRLKR